MSWRRPSVGETGARRVTYTGFYDSDSRSVRGVVPTEASVTLHVNGEALVRLLCTPTRLKDLAAGFLFNEGLIDRWDDVAVVELCGGGEGVDVWLTHDIEPPSVRSITSGCSGGTTFEDVGAAEHRITSNLRVAPEEVTGLMEQLAEEAALYRRAGGVHTAALAFRGERALFCLAEDVGRHNTVDKIAGSCLRQGRPTEDGILLTSGRVSSEVVGKAARMSVPLVASRTSPTALSVDLAEVWGITLAGYVRRRSLRVYTGRERICSSNL